MHSPETVTTVAAYVTVLVSTAGTFESGPECGSDGRYRLGPTLFPRTSWANVGSSFATASGPSLPMFFQAHLSEARSLSDLASGLAYVRGQPYWAISRHHPAPGFEQGEPLTRGAAPGQVEAPALLDLPKSWLCVQVDVGPERAAAQRELFGDEVSAEAFRAEPAAYLGKVRDRGLPPAFARARCYWSIHMAPPHIPGVFGQLWFWLRQPLTCAQVAAALAPSEAWIDLGAFDAGRLIWTARAPASGSSLGAAEGFLSGDEAVALSVSRECSATRVYVRLPEYEHDLEVEQLGWLLQLDADGSLAAMQEVVAGVEPAGDARFASHVRSLRGAFPYASASSLWAVVAGWMERAGAASDPGRVARGLQLAEREAAYRDGPGEELQAVDVGRLSLELADKQPALAADLRALLGAAGEEAGGERLPPSRPSLIAALQALSRRYPGRTIGRLSPRLCYYGALSPRAAVDAFAAVAPDSALPHGGPPKVTWLPLSLSADGQRAAGFAVATDGLAADFVAAHEGQLLFSDDTWYRFTPASPHGGVWRPLDGQKTPQPLLAEYARAMIELALGPLDVDGTLCAAALEACHTSSTIQKACSHYPHVRWGAHPTGLNTPLGFVDLNHGGIERTTPQMYLRQMTAVTASRRGGRFIHPPLEAGAYGAYLRALEPRLCEFLRAIAGESALEDGFVRFLQVALGVSVVGARPPEEVDGRGDGYAFVCAGEAATEAHVELLRAVRAALGSAYVRTLSTDDLASGGPPVPVLARRLLGARMAVVVASDAAELGHSPLKMIQSARAVHVPDAAPGQPQEYALGLCTWILGGVESMSESLQGEGVQVKVLPFAGRVTPGPWTSRLSAALLTFMIEGAMEYLRTGQLPACRRVEEATVDPLSQADAIQEFLDGCFVIEDGGRISREDLWRTYRSYCAHMGQSPLTRNALYAELRSRGFKESRSNNPRLWLGLTLSSADLSAQRFN